MMPFWKVMKNVKYDSNGVAKRKSKILATICVFIVVLILITLLVYVFIRIFSGSKNDVPTTNIYFKNLSAPVGQASTHRLQSVQASFGGSSFKQTSSSIGIFNTISPG